MAVRGKDAPPASDQSADRYRAPALDKGLDIIEVLAEREAGLSQAEIAKELGRKPNEIYRMLDRLVRRGYVLRTDADQYELTLKLFELAYRQSPTRRLASHALPHMRRFAQVTGQACHLSVQERGSLTVIAQIDAPGYWGFGIRLGSRLGLLDTGSGLVMLAFASAASRDLMMLENSKPSQAVMSELSADIERVRGQHYAMMPSQQTEAVYNIAVPVFSSPGNIVGVLACPYLQHLDTDRLPGREAVLGHLQGVAQSLSQPAGHGGNLPGATTPSDAPRTDGD